MTSKFVRAWYKNTRENQEALFKLGYSWDSVGKGYYLTRSNLMFTNPNGSLTHGNFSGVGDVEGTQIKLPLTAKRIQESFDTFKEMLSICPNTSFYSQNKQTVIRAGDVVARASYTPQQWMDEFLPTKSKEQIELEKVVEDLKKSLNDAQEKLKGMGYDYS